MLDTPILPGLADSPWDFIPSPLIRGLNAGHADPPRARGLARGFIPSPLIRGLNVGRADPPRCRRLAMGFNPSPLIRGLNVGHADSPRARRLALGFIPSPLIRGFPDQLYFTPDRAAYSDSVLPDRVEQPRSACRRSPADWPPARRRRRQR